MAAMMVQWCVPSYPFSSWSLYLFPQQKKVSPETPHNNNVAVSSTNEKSWLAVGGNSWLGLWETKKCQCLSYITKKGRFWAPWNLLITPFPQSSGPQPLSLWPILFHDHHTFIGPPRHLNPFTRLEIDIRVKWLYPENTSPIFLTTGLSSL